MIDLHSRVVIGWSMSTRMTAALACDALSMAPWRRGFPMTEVVSIAQIFIGILSASIN